MPKPHADPDAHPICSGYLQAVCRLPVHDATYNRATIMLLGSSVVSSMGSLVVFGNEADVTQRLRFWGTPAWARNKQL